MPIFKVYVLQREMLTRKRLYEVEAPDEKSAMLLAKNGEVNAIDCSLFDEPYIGDSGFAALPPDADSAVGWDQALSSLDYVKGNSASLPPSVVAVLPAVRGSDNATSEVENNLEIQDGVPSLRNSTDYELCAFHV